MYSSYRILYSKFGINLCISYKISVERINFYLLIKYSTIKRTCNNVPKYALKIRESGVTEAHLSMRDMRTE